MSFLPCCHVGTGCHPAYSGGGPASSQLLRSAAADPAAFLLHYPDVGIVDAFSVSVPQSDSEATLVYLKEKVFHLLLSQNIACIANIQWCDYGTMFSCTVTKADLNEIQTKILVQFGEKMINGITGFS